MAKKKKITVDFYEKKGKPFCTIIYNRKNTKFNYTNINRDFKSISDIDIDNEIKSINGIIRYIEQNINSNYNLAGFHLLFEFLRMPLQYSGTTIFNDLGNILTYNQFRRGGHERLLERIKFIIKNYKIDIFSRLAPKSIYEFIQHLYLIEFSRITKYKNRVDWIIDQSSLERYSKFISDVPLKKLLKKHNLNIEIENYKNKFDHIKMLKSGIKDNIIEYIKDMSI